MYVPVDILRDEQTGALGALAEEVLHKVVRDARCVPAAVAAALKRVIRYKL